MAANKPWEYSCGKPTAVMIPPAIWLANDKENMRKR